jgi:hypothetical protein
MGVISTCSRIITSGCAIGLVTHHDPAQQPIAPHHHPHAIDLEAGLGHGGLGCLPPDLL